jgi:SAM-dependent methyltransferase
MGSGVAAAHPYLPQGGDAVRGTFERDWFARTVPRLLREAGGGEVLDLGCADGAAARMAGGGLTRYLGVDLATPARTNSTFDCVRHDLREGLGPVGTRPFDVYLGTFGVASHLAPEELRRLVREIAGHARPGAVVALEALGRYSLEWPQLWGTAVGRARTIAYRLAADVRIHPWSPVELLGLLEECGIRPVGAVDRTIQAGPKLGEGRYWPGLPDVRAALNALLAGRSAPATALAALAAPLPPLPAGRPALIHHALAARRRTLVDAALPAAALARAIWSLEPATGGGYGHGLRGVGRIV